MKINDLKNKKIVILGFGREGRDSFLVLRKLFPGQTVGIADQKEFPISNFQFSNTKLHIGKNYLKAIKDYDIVIKSPGIPIHFPQVEKARKQGKITSATEIFFSNCRGKIIGITGTKGKGTASSLIYRILREEGLKAYLMGNIGKPALSFLLSDDPENIYIYELSSHQLFNLKRAPQIAVFLNIYPDHLDYFKNFQEYISAKSGIIKRQKKGDWLVYNDRDVLVRKIAEESKARKISIGDYGKVLKYVGIKKLPHSLPGYHNLLNMAAAVKVAQIFKVPKAKIKRAIEKFETRSHRLEYVGKFQGIDFYNDSASTIPESTEAALRALGSKVQTIILGGSEKGSEFHNLAKRILKSKIKSVVLFPENGRIIWQSFLSGKSQKLPEHFFVDDMRKAVELSFKRTQKNKICLLSPASASFTVFKDYRERGDLFKKWVKKYGKSKSL